MWLILGASAIITAMLNILYAVAKKRNRWLGFASLSLTALTVCAFYWDAAQRVIREDWGGLMDILPATSKVLWFCVICSILINAIPMFIKQDRD